MERSAAKSKNKILGLLPKVAQAAVSFRNPPFSPGRDKRPDVVNSHKLKNHMSKGFSGPIVSMFPAEAQGKSKNFETKEPTSPKISCMGQIKDKHKICKKKQASLPKEFKPEKISEVRPVGRGPKLKKKPSGIKKIFMSGRKSEASIDQGKPPLPVRAPSLSQMRRFASSRDTFANFDWTSAQIAPEGEGRHFYSDDDRDFRPVGRGPELKKKPSGIKKIFMSGRKSDASIDQGKPPLPDRAPSLSQMRRFASSRDTSANFDWTSAQIAPEGEDRYFYSDDDRDYSDGEDDVIIPFSAPILLAGAGARGGLALEPRKEINLWKRRTMSQPKPLQLNMVREQ